ncbi:Vitamin B12 ABC transporter, permease component BtuC [Streptococcus oralis]|nr:Vitamin B12 ABC transporter, permease component BtuC [Streptococcus oralis]
MLSKFSGSRQDLQFVLFLGILLGVLGISLFIAVSMGSCCD